MLRDQDLLPIQKISQDVKTYKNKLGVKLTELNMDEKKHPMKVFKKLLGAMSESLIDLVDNFPAFKVEAVFDEEALLDDQKQEIDKQVSVALTEREKSQAALRDALGDVEDKREEKKDERLLIEVATQGKLAELRVEQVVEEKANWCTRTFSCCLFSQTKRKLEDLNSVKLQKQQENAAELSQIEQEKARLKLEAEMKTAADHTVIDEKLEIRIEVIRAKAEAKVRAERGYNAYKYTISEDMMLLLIRLNSCVRRIQMLFNTTVTASANEKTPLKDQENVKHMNVFLKNFDEALNNQCKALYCVDPDDDGHKIYFSDFYRRFHKLSETEKTAIVDGNISAKSLQTIFSWEVPLQAQLPVTSVTSTSLSRRGSSRNIH